VEKKVRKQRKKVVTEPNPETPKKPDARTRLQCLSLACSCVNVFHETRSVVALAKEFEGYVTGGEA